jgi:hypothetical protein
MSNCSRNENLLKLPRGELYDKHYSKKKKTKLRSPIQLMQSVFFFVFILCLLFTFQSDFIYYTIYFWICAVKVRNAAKLRNYLKTEEKYNLREKVHSTKCIYTNSSFQYCCLNGIFSGFMYSIPLSTTFIV